MKKTSGSAEESHPSQFCALAYRAEDRSIDSSRNTVIVLLVLRNELGSLRFLIHPELRTIVQGEDLTYTEALLQDFLRRAKQDPAALFKQISSLGVGPFVTQEAGSSLSEYPFIQELSTQFIQI
jgi:hypothetical protein